MQADFLSSGSFAVNTSGLNITSGAANTIKIDNITHYTIKGDGKVKAVTTGITTPTTDINTSAAFVAVPINKACAFTVGLAADGTTFVAAQGPIVDWDGTSSAPSYGFGNQIPRAPALADPAYAALGVILVKNAATGSNFTFGTTNWNATGLTIAPHSILFGGGPRPFLT